MPDLTARTGLLALIGSPVAHSLSPRIQNRFAEKLGLAYAYLAFDIAPDALAGFAQAARLLPLAGFNVTMPHKAAILAHLDGLDGSAARCGAANTVVNRGGRLLGHNTDGVGFLLSLERAGLDISGGKALILGAGGAARPVALELARKGVEVKLAVRRAPELPAPEGAAYCAWDRIAEEARGCGLLVNATPLGMEGWPEDFHDFSFLDYLPRQTLVCDLIYAPRETGLLRAARERGLRAGNGLPHLVCQAALSFGLFTGVTPSPKLVSEGIAAL